MNRNLNVFWGLVLCVGMIVGLTVLTHRSVSESDYGNPNEFYNSSSARTYSHVSSSAAVADGVGVPMRSTSSMRRGSSFVYAPAYTTPNSPIASSPNGPIASSPISYTSSSATAKSFGSGIGAGVSMSGGAVRSAGGSVSMSGGSISSPISLPSREGTGVGFNSLIALSPTSPITSSPIVITDPAQAAASYEGIGNTTGGPRGIRGRFNAPPGMGGEEGDSEGSSYEAWLEWMWRHGWRFGTETGENTWYFNSDQSRAAFEAWYLSVYGIPYDESNALTPPEFTYDEWLQWISGTHTYNGYTFTPVGDILPLIMMALAYIGYLCYKRRRMMRTRSFVN